MKKKKDHAAPWRCLRKVRRHEPTVESFAICEIGAGACKRCEGCKHYKPQNLIDGIIRKVTRLSEALKATSFALTLAPKREEGKE